jgi:hypothetical protein
MILLYPEDINRGGSDIPSGGKCHTAEEVKTDPQPPGVIVGKVGDCGQTSGEPEDRDDESYKNNDPRDNIERGQE